MTTFPERSVPIDCSDDCLRHLRIASEGYYHKPYATLAASFELRAYQAVDAHITSPALDLGCSDGTFISILRRTLNTTSRFIGVDIDDRALAAAERLRSECYERLVRAPADVLPFDSGHFQTAVCNGMLQATVDPSRVLAELARVLAPGATLYCTVPTHRWSEQYCLRKPLRGLGLHGLERRYVASLDSRLGHSHTLRPEEWRAMFENAGFSVDCLTGCFPPDFVSKWSVLALPMFRAHGLLRFRPLRLLRSAAAANQQAMFARYLLRSPALCDANESGYLLIGARQYK